MPQYADIGKGIKDLLSGSAKSGAFQLEPKLAFSSTAGPGVTFAVSAVKNAAQTVDGTLKMSYGTKKYSADATLAPGGKVTVNASLANALEAAGVPGIKLGATAPLHDLAAAKMSMEYNPCKEFGMKKSWTLSSAPVVDVSCGSVYKGVQAGAELTYNAGKGDITKQNVAIGYIADDFSVSAHYIGLETNKKTKAVSALARLAYVHKLSDATTAGAEVERNLSDGTVNFCLGYAKKLASGALAKLKLDSQGLLSALYEAKLASGEKVAGCLQLQATDPSQPVKYGFAVDLS